MANGSGEQPGRGKARYDAGSTVPRPPRNVSADDNSGAGDGSPARERMSLAELTEAAGVSVRTVRYYIAEGLLPPPAGAGPGSAYAPGHLARLQLIQRLKEDYLPLREIRRRLSGLGDDEVQSILAAHGAAPANDSPGPHDPALAGARDYLALLETRERYRTEPLALSIPPSPAPASSMSAPLAPPAQVQPAAALASDRALLKQAGPVENFMPPEQPRDDELWRRISLGDGAELVIAERIYARHRDRIDWLVRWARKVFN